MSYNNYPPSYDYDQAYQQQRYGHPQASDAQRQQQYSQQYGGNSVRGNMPRAAVPNPPQQRYSSAADNQQYAAWNYQQQQAVMARYSAQPQPPIYPPPAYAYPQYHSYPQSAPVPASMGYYGYPQPPAPASVSAYPNSATQSGLRHGAPSAAAAMALYAQGVPPPLPVPPVAPQSDTQRHVQQTAPLDIKSDPGSSSESKEVKKQPIVVGKRRGGRVLPTGVVKKQKTETTMQVAKDPWSQYMHEVKRYKDESCEDDNRKNRPLVK